MMINTKLYIPTCIIKLISNHKYKKNNRKYAVNWLKDITGKPLGECLCLVNKWGDKYAPSEQELRQEAENFKKALEDYRINQ